MNGSGSDGFLSKGTCTPLWGRQNTDGLDLDAGDPASKKYSPARNRPLILIPSWCANGIFKSDRNGNRCGSNAGHDDEDGGSRKRRRRRRRRGDIHDNDNNMERLLRDQCRRCDVCARDVVWTPSLERRFFSSSSSARDDPPSPSPRKSIAESLPRFVERHVPPSAPLPCSFCTSKNGKDGWCGSLYCGADCRIRGEAAVASKATNGGATATPSQASSSCPNLPPPKLFFCRNQFVDDAEPPEAERDNQNEYHELVKEVADSMSAIEKRFQSLLGHDEDPETGVEIFGVEECALLLATTISCTSPHWMSDMTNKLGALPSVRDVNEDEGNLVEEMYAMSRSHGSLCGLLQKYNNPIRGAPKSSANTISSRTFPSYGDFLQCYLDIKRFCLLRVDAPMHPLASYATKTVISPQALTEEERDLALDLLERSRFPPNPTTTEGGVRMAVLRWRNAAHFAHWASASTASGDTESKRIGPLLRRSYFAYSPGLFRRMSHSCSPTVALVMPDSSKKESGDREQSPLDRLAWLALHDAPFSESSISKLGSLEDDVHSRSVGLKRLMGHGFVCSCVRCKYECELSEPGGAVLCLSETTKNVGSNALLFCRQQLKCLADLAMQQGRFDDASTLYSSILRTHPQDGDILHARAASYLGRASSLSYADIGHCQGYFMKAQRLWKEAGSVSECATHPQIAIQKEKHNVFKTFSFGVERQEGSESNADSVAFDSLLNGKCFVTSDSTPVLSQKECQNVIDAAEERASKSEKDGWTTSRHYAVPTTDIPLHELRKLHTWFYQLWKGTIRPLLRRQFKLVSSIAHANTQCRDIFLHDVFVVRYDADRQRYLPPHYDESTHSFIIALNGNFEGGGTFIHSLDKTLTPSAGGMLSFCGGELLHSGDPVVEGLRYIIAAFCYVDLAGDRAAGFELGQPPASVPKEKPSSQTHNQSKLTGIFAGDSSKSEMTAGSVHKKGQQAFSFGFAL